MHMALFFSANAGKTDAEGASERLWLKMLSYAKLRVDGYRKELNQIFNANRRQIKKGSSRHYSRESRAATDLQCVMSEMHDKLCGTASIGKDDDTLSRLVQTAYKVRKWANTERELGSSWKTPLSQRRFIADFVSSGDCALHMKLSGK